MRTNFFPLLFGGLVGTLLDQIHVRSGLVVYAHPFLFGQAWWVPLLFGVAAIALVRVPAVVSRTFLTVPPPLAGSAQEAATRSFVWFVAAYLATGVLASYPKLACLLLLGTWALRVISSAGDRHERNVLVGLSLTAGIIGPLVEVTMVGLGAFMWPRPGEVIFWLPGLYLHAGLLGRDASRAWFGGH